MIIWIAHITFVGFFTFINYAFFVALELRLWRSLVISLGILLAINVTIADMTLVFNRWNERIENAMNIAEKITGNTNYLPVQGKITQGYNPPHHHGIDISVSSGTPIQAQGYGIVTLAEHQEVYGNVVVVKYDTGYEGLYAHLSTLNVRYGNRVYKDKTIIGYTGNTGKSYGPHLHYEVRYRGIAVEPNKL